MHTHVGRAPFLQHREDVPQQDLNGESSLPLGLYLHMLAKLPLHLLHALKGGIGPTAVR